MKWQEERQKYRGTRGRWRLDNLRENKRVTLGRPEEEETNKIRLEAGAWGKGR